MCVCVWTMSRPGTQDVSRDAVTMFFTVDCILHQVDAVSNRASRRPHHPSLAERDTLKCITLCICDPAALLLFC